IRAESCETCPRKCHKKAAAFTYKCYRSTCVTVKELDSEYLLSATQQENVQRSTTNCQRSIKFVPHFETPQLAAEIRQKLTKGTKAFWSAANPTLRFLRFLLLYCFAFCPSSLISRGHDGACPSTQKMVYVDVWKIQTTMKSTRFPIRSALVVVFFAALWLILWRQLSGEWSVNDQ